MTSAKKPAAAGRPQPNRQQLIAKLHKALKASYKPPATSGSRPLLE